MSWLLGAWGDPDETWAIFVPAPETTFLVGPPRYSSLVFFANIISNYHLDVVLRARISLTLSQHSSQLSIVSGRPSCICTEQFLISSSSSSNTCTSVWRSPLKNVAYKFVLSSPAVSGMFCLCYLGGFRDGRLVSVQLLFCAMLLPRFVQYSL